MVDVKRESEHRDNWEVSESEQIKKLKWKVINWEIDEKYVWERWRFKWKVEIYLWTVKVKMLENWWGI